MTVSQWSLALRVVDTYNLDYNFNSSCSLMENIKRRKETVDSTFGIISRLISLRLKGYPASDDAKYREYR